ncbi:DUF5666 domain-containing protein [uncultured Roseobacter sp.]|uniref:DUF5666 domain-containing protein n=1 Tax=uncultured Roseobacter sp. TaxID=114847 RepID=UPI002608438F|nr:DUF5666 domain-containing protein [uncultured Roseobacter sp.]
MKTGNLSRRAAVFSGMAACALPRGVLGQERELEGGIGGTGIVGILTDLNGFIVAGRSVAINAGTVLVDAFGPLPTGSLVPGDSLTVEAAASGDGLVARRVYLTQPVVGPVSAVSGQRAVVNGVEVALTSGMQRPRVGDRVAVSGLWQGNRVIASRLSTARSPRDVIAGDVTRRIGRLAVGGVPVTRVGAAQTDGSFATVYGRYDTAAGRFIVENTQGGRFVLAAGPLKHLAVEGFLEPTRQAPEFRISGLGHSFARNLRLAEFADRRVLFSGPYKDVFAADKAVILPEDPRRRRNVLRTLSTRT